MKTTLRRIFHTYTPAPGWLAHTRLGRALWTRKRVWLSVAAGLAAAALLPDTLALPARMISAWCVAGWLYLLQCLALMATADHGSIRARARHEDDGAAAILLLIVLGAGASLAAVVLELAGQSGTLRVGTVALAGGTIATSWLIIHTAYAVHYAHRYYASAHGADVHEATAPLDFPGPQAPMYVDFLYFSFTIGATSQTSDVAVRTAAMRAIVLVHAVVAFLFNTTLLALTINIGASMLRP